jgi:hypothetical protein
VARREVSDRVRRQALAIDLLAVAEIKHQDDEDVVEDLIDDPIVFYPYSVTNVFRLELRISVRAWVLCKLVDLGDDLDRMFCGSFLRSLRAAGEIWIS